MGIHVQKWLLIIILVIAIFSPVFIKSGLAYSLKVGLRDHYYSQTPCVKAASYEDFSYVKAKYREDLERIKASPFPFSREGVLILIGLVVILFFLFIFFGVSMWFAPLTFIGIVLHFRLVGFLVELVNTNYFFYKLFLNPLVIFLFGVRRTEDCVVFEMGWSFIRGTHGAAVISIGFLSIYCCIGALVSYFLIYNERNKCS